jgi:hypothetical protein
MSLTTAKLFHRVQKNMVFFFPFFFIFTPPTSLVYNFLEFFPLKLSDLNCSEIINLKLYKSSSSSSNSKDNKQSNIQGYFFLVKGVQN